MLLVCVVGWREWAPNAGIHDDEILVASDVHLARPQRPPHCAPIKAAILMELVPGQHRAV